MGYSDDEMSLEEETSHAKRGACLAMIVFPPAICCLLWVVLTFTADGQTLASRGYLYLTFNGVPLHNLTEGFPGIARASCALDQRSPQPQNYESMQANFAEYYGTLVGLYRDSWNRLNARGEDVSQYPEPDRIPGDLARGKQLYCR